MAVASLGPVVIVAILAGRLVVVDVTAVVSVPVTASVVVASMTALFATMIVGFGALGPAPLFVAGAALPILEATA